MESPASKDTEAIAQRLIKFVTGDCFGGKFAQGLNSLLCSLILYIFIVWVFVGDNSLWARFKRLEDGVTTLAGAITTNADHQQQFETASDKHFSALDGKVSQMDERVDALRTKTAVLDATTCKIGRKC